MVSGFIKPLHLFIELPDVFYKVIVDFQKEYSRLNSDKELLKSNLTKTLSDSLSYNSGEVKSTIELISKATDYNIKVHAADPEDGTAKLLEKYPKEMGILMGTSRDVDNELENMSIWQRLKHAYVTARFFSERTNVDKKVADTVKELAQDESGNPERAIIVFGAFHSFKKEDIDEYLGKDKTLSVAIYENREYKDELIDSLGDSGITLSNIDHPQYEIFLDSAERLGTLCASTSHSHSIGR